jgi:hypothetical protein
MGFEDASAMLQSAEMQNILTQYSAQRQAGQYEMAGEAGRRTSGLMAGATLTAGAIQGAKTILKA